MWFWVFDWSLTFFFILSSSSPSLQENLWKKCCWQTWPSRPPGGLQKRQSTPSIPCWKRTDARTMTLPLAYNPSRHHRLLFKYYTHILAHTSLYSCSATKSTGPSTCSMMMSFSFDPLATRSGKMYVYVVWDLHLHLHGNLCFSSFLLGRGAQWTRNFLCTESVNDRRTRHWHRTIQYNVYLLEYSRAQGSKGSREDPARFSVGLRRAIWTWT